MLDAMQVPAKKINTNRWDIEKEGFEFMLSFVFVHDSTARCSLYNLAEHVGEKREVDQSPIIDWSNE